MKKIILSELENFIKDEKGITEKLLNDLNNLRVRKESEFENCIYYHLREFLKIDESWKILTSSFVKNSRQKKSLIVKKVKIRFHPDIILYEKSHEKFIPKIGIEIKWNRSKIHPKDRKSLRKLIEKGLRQVYFITSVIPPKKYEKLGIRKIKMEKNKLFEIPVNLSVADEKKWKKDRKKFREIGNI